MADDKEIVTIDNDFPSNADCDKQYKTDKDEPTLKKVNPNAISNNKRGFFSKFMDIAGDILKYTLDEVLVPTFKKTASDMIITASDRAIWGESAPRRNSWWDDRYIDYSGYSRPREISYNRRDDYSYSSSFVSRRNKNELPPLEFNIESDARDFLNNLVDVLDYKHELTVNSVYDAYGREDYLREIDYTWANYGWEDTAGRDLRGADIRPIRGRFIVVLPRPVALER